MPIAADILATLPNPLLVLIFSKFPIREVIRCFVLSKIWSFFYVHLSQNTLSSFLLMGTVKPNLDPLSIVIFEKIIIDNGGFTFIQLHFTGSGGFTCIQLHFLMGWCQEEKLEIYSSNPMEMGKVSNYKVWCLREKQCWRIYKC